MPKVYVLNRGSHDYSAAKKYGELVFCTDGVLNKFNTSQMHRECSAAMAESTAEDFILLTSLSVLCAVACSHFVSKHGRLNLLLFKDVGYQVRTLVFNK